MSKARDLPPTSPTKCPRCSGSGSNGTWTTTHPDGTTTTGQFTCDRCYGTGMT